MIKVSPTAVSSLCALALLFVMLVACKTSSLPGAKMNMFQGSNAIDGANKIKQKVGVDDLRIKNLEIHEDRMQITVQDPAKPKNFDEYTYEKGEVKGPKPVQALVLGNQELTADKLKLFGLSEINLAAVPETCKKALERAQIENGKCELISVDWQVASLRLTKAEIEKKRAQEREEFTKQARSGKLDPMAQMRKGRELAVTWRIFLEGPHMRKDLWADEKGNIFEPTW